MEYFAGCVLPLAWRTALEGEAPPPKEPFVVNFSEVDEVHVQVRIKILNPGGRVISLSLVDDGWEEDEAVLDEPATVELTDGRDRYKVIVRWEDDPQLLSYLAADAARREGDCHAQG